MNEKACILVVEDEARLQDMIRMILENRGYRVLLAENGEEGVALAKVMEPNLILMDVMMPKLDGFNACKRIRDFSTCPIIMLTAKGEDYDQVHGFSMGADDYIIKPFAPMVLMARIEAALKRSSTAEDIALVSRLVIGELIIDLDARDVLIGGSPIEMNRREFDLLCYLAKNLGISLSRDIILEKVWGYDYLGSDSTVDSHINKIRKKLGACSTYLRTVRGYGYKFEVTYDDEFDS